MGIYCVLRRLSQDWDDQVRLHIIFPLHTRNRCSCKMRLVERSEQRRRRDLEAGQDRVAVAHQHEIGCLVPYLQQGR